MQVFLFSGIVVIVLYYLINRRSIKILLSKEYIEKYSPPLNKKEFSIECYSLFTIPIAEEFFFRNFLFSLFNKSLISVIFTVLIISFLFVVSHYNSPWAPYLMGKKDLFWLFILSSFLIILKLSFQSIILCILVHYFFNLPTFLNYLSRLKKSKVYK
ncbi:CPBP family intramembrane glutamic endopeptidase [Parasphaerochaeta coccoides]